MVLDGKIMFWFELQIKKTSKISYTLYNSSLFINYFLLHNKEMDIQHQFKATQFSFYCNQSQQQPLPFEFYDQQSQSSQLYLPNSLPYVIQVMGQNQDIIDRPIPEIVNQAINAYDLRQADVDEFMKRIKKTKNILKRNRAKNRKYTNNSKTPRILVKRQHLQDESSTNKDNGSLQQKQQKKQKNRISAQISRDRKKYYVTNLEIENKQLSKQSEKIKMQNQRLKKLIQNKNQTKNSNKEQNKYKVGNKLTRLLVLLGFMFLVYLVQDILNLKSNKPVGPLKIEKDQDIEKQDLSTTTISQTADIVEQIRKQMNQIEVEAEDKGTISIISKASASLKQALINKVIEIKRKTKQIILPTNLAAYMVQIKNTFNF